MELAAAESWMREAIEEARKAGGEGEVPVGALVLLNGKVIGRGRNCPICSHDPSAHAEIVALRQAAHNAGNYRLPGTVLVVTVEPCVMCVGAMVHARVEEVVYGACDPKGGAVDSHFHLADDGALNHRIRVTGGVLAEECGALMKEFFAARRRQGAP
ncbi:MAG: tRNA adenosine(34) deaminase TadA [Acidobacteriota bacterium]|jgi:tRNA(adenine34) deaminase|nr:tRNA adenosine(34) deaminase TadA [Acidobacteriota bacterium]